MGSRFSTRIVNSGHKPLNVKIIADWQMPNRVLNHDLGYVSNDGADDWIMIPAFRKSESVLEYRLTARPGTTCLGLYPEYNYERCANFVRGLAKRKDIRVKTIGKSRERRDIWLLNFPSQNKGTKNFFIQARDHAYETAGSYCMEGISGFLLSDDPLSRYLRSKFNVYIVPMTNPDGVVNGMSRLTWEMGANLNRVHTVKDAAHATLKKTIDSLKPSVYMNIHNWTYKFVDGLLVNEKEIADLVKQHMPDDRANFKRWGVETLADYLNEHKLALVPKADKSWKDYCRENFGAVCATFEFPWPFLTPAQMKSKGKTAFISLALSTIEYKKL